ncbi:hypothetical protein IAD21_06033 [Abditibacteriota bacterium]|nr:hypothetical protein IAD21_06033 [Abditibacteriota bacterium]
MNLRERVNVVSPVGDSSPAEGQSPKGERNGHLRRVCDVRDLVEEASRGNWDTLARRDELSFCQGQLVLPSPLAGHDSLSPTNWATGQLCARLGIPAPYYRRCSPEIQDIQANHWLRQKPQDGDGEIWLLRAQDARLRAVLSQRYSPLDNTDLMEVLQPLLKPDLRVDWLDQSDDGLHLRIVDPSRMQDVLPGDGLSVGIHIANSEVGGRSLSVDALVYRLLCSNGLIRLVQGKSLLRQRHIHIARPRLVAALEEAVECAWQEADLFLEQMGRTTQIRVPDVEGVIERIGHKWHLPQNVQSEVMEDLRRAPAKLQETLYGMVNAFTSTAQRQSSEARYDLEVLAGHLVEHGVAAYAPKRRFDPLADDDLEAEEFEAEPSAPGFSGSKRFDAVEATRELMEAQIVSRRPRLREVNGR